MFSTVGIPGADKSYTLVLYHVCPVAWLKIARLCPYLSYFPGFLVILKVCFFRKWGDKPYTKAVKQHVFSQFFKTVAKVTIFFKKAQLFWLKGKDKPNSRYVSKTFSTELFFVELLDCFRGTKLTTVMCVWSKLRLKQVTLIWVLASFRRT